MDADLTAVAAALADLDDDQLRALIAAVNGCPQAAPGLLAWLEHAADWEISRRRGFDYPLLPPDAAIPPAARAAAPGVPVLVAAVGGDSGNR